MSDHRRPRELDHHLYRERNQVERLSGRLKECRRVSTRDEETARDDLASCQLASVMILLACLSADPSPPERHPKWILQTSPGYGTNAEPSPVRPEQNLE